MATPTLDVGLLEHFSPIILWMLVFAILYALFQWAKILGENRSLHAIIAFLIAIFVALLSPSAAAMVRFMIPWYTVLGIFAVFAIMLYKIFGATDADIRGVITGRKELIWTVFVVIVIILLGALSSAFGQTQLNLGQGYNSSTDSTGGIDMQKPDSTDTSTDSFNQNLAATFYHPKVVGTLFMLIIGSLSIAFLTRPVFK